MARKKVGTGTGVAASPVEAEAPIEAPVPTEAEAAPAQATTEQDAVDAFIERLNKMASFDGGLIWVDCPLEGYEGVRVAYNTENRFALDILFAERPKGIPLEDDYKLMSLFVRRVEWPFNVPTPTPEDPQSYESLWMQFFSLTKWIRGEGYKKAKEVRWGN